MVDQYSKGHNMEEHNTQLGLHGQGSTHIVSSQHSTDQENQSGDEEGQSPNNKRRRLSVDQEAAPKGPMKSRYLGVTWRKAQQGWAAQLTVNSKPVNLGTFDTEEVGQGSCLPLCRLFTVLFYVTSQLHSKTL